MEITRGIIPSAKKVVIYGPEGIGKSTFASKFPDPVFIDTEGSTKMLDVARLPFPSSWTHLKEEVRYILQHPDACRTLVIDTADWAEKLAIQAVLDEKGKDGIEDFGYGNGYRYVFERFGELLNLLTEVINKNINVVITAHAVLRKFEQPDEMGSYDRYTMKLIDSPKTSIAAAVKEWSDIVLFANYKTIVVTDSKTKKTRAQGGQRVMYSTHHPCWDAKNRFDLPEEMPFDYEKISHLFTRNSAPISQNFEPAREEIVPDKSPEEPAKKAPEPAPAPTPTVAKTEPETPPRKEPDARIPKALRDLMILDNVDEWDIEMLAESKGFVPTGTKIWDYENVNPGIIEGLFVAQWDKVKSMISEMKTTAEIPFN